MSAGRLGAAVTSLDRASIASRGPERVSAPAFQPQPLITIGGCLFAGRLLALLLCLLVPGVAFAQFGGSPYPGTKPIKSAGGPDVTWNGTSWQVPPGGEIIWTVHVVHDSPLHSAVTVWVQDDIPDPADARPVAAFNLATDVLASPAGVPLSYNGDDLLLDEAPLSLGQSFDLIFRNRVLSTAPLGTNLCNRAIVTYLADSGLADPPTPPPRYTSSSRLPDGTNDATCVVVAAGTNLAESTKIAADADGDGLIEPGEDVTYTITVRNTGTSDATNVIVTDLVPDDLAIGAVGQGGQVSGQLITWNSATTAALGRVRPGNTAVLTFTARMGCPTVALTCNQARISSTEIMPDVGTDDPSDGTPSSATCLPAGRPILDASPLTVTDASGDGQFDAGENVTVLLRVTNSGIAPALGVSARIDIPAGLIDVVPASGGILGGGSVTWTSAEEPALATIDPFSSVPLSFTARIDPASADSSIECLRGTLTAGGCGDGLSNDPSTPAALDPTCFVVRSLPELRFTLVATDENGDGVTSAPEVVDYELRIEHVSGAAANDLAVVLTAPVGTLIGGLTADDGGVVMGNVVRWDAASTPELVSIGPGAVVILGAQGVTACTAPDGVTACASATLSGANVASLASDDPALPGAADPTCVAVAAAVLEVLLTATEAGGDGLFDAGETVTLVVDVLNVGGAPARDVIVTVPLLVSDLDILTTPSALQTATEVTWDAGLVPALALLDAGSSVDLTLRLRIDPVVAGTRGCHQASVTHAGLTGCPSVVSTDPAGGLPNLPTCWDVNGDGLPPGEVPDGNPLGAGPIPVRLSCAGDDLEITWAVAPRALTHSIYRGDMASFQARPWTNPAAFIDDPENAVSSCELTVLRYTDEGECAPGGADHYFLIQGRNLIGDGPLGNSVTSAGATPRPSITVPCP